MDANEKERGKEEEEEGGKKEEEEEEEEKRKKEGRAEVRRLCTALSYVTKAIRKHSILYAPLSLDYKRLSAQ